MLSGVGCPRTYSRCVEMQTRCMHDDHSLRVCKGFSPAHAFRPTYKGLYYQGCELVLSCVARLVLANAHRRCRPGCHHRGCTSKSDIGAIEHPTSTTPRAYHACH